MKKAFVFLALIVICLSSCQQAKFTVKNIPLNDDERRIADLTSDMVEKFIFEKDKIYDINLYIYKNNSLELGASILGIYTKDEDTTVFISGRKGGDFGFVWNVSYAAGKYQLSDIEIYEDITHMMVTTSGVGQEKFVMEEDKEYALGFVAYREGNEIPISAVEPFHIWDEIEDKADALSEFKYAQFITVKFSDETGENVIIK